MSAANLGRGACAERLDDGRQCPQAAYRDAFCYWHAKLAQRLTRRLAAEDKPAPAPRKKAKP